MDRALNDDLNGVDWGFNGTNEFQFYDVAVTSVVYHDGSTSEGDSIVDHNIIGNLKHPFAKLTDLDTDMQDHSTVYGMNFGISWGSDNSQDIAFYGKWTPNVIAQDLWPRLKCYDENNHGPELFQDSFPLGAQSTTKITNVDWKNISDSQVLNEMMDAVNGGDLVVRVSIFYYTRNYPTYVPFNATLGYVVGVIGVPGPRDTLNVPGQRVLSFTNNFPVGLTFDQGDLCEGVNDISKFGPWMHSAPVEVDTTRSIIHLDLSNSIPSDLYNSLRNIGSLRIAMLRNDCVQILGEEEIPYYSNKQLPISSGIYDINVDYSLLDDLDDYPLVLGQYLNDNYGTPICGAFLLKGGEDSRSLNILLKEHEYFIRPNGYYVDRLDRLEKPSCKMDLYVTRYGKPVVVNVSVESAGTFLPADGVVASTNTAMTDNNGIASFQFQLHEYVIIPAEREYGTPQCTDSKDPSDQLELPIDGQVYNFTYCVEGDIQVCQTLYSFAFLAFSDLIYVEIPTWVDDVEPILAQFARLAAIMDTVLDMSSYTDVTKPHNVNLLKKVLNLDFEDPSYMPTTRDLSPSKREMILRWLDNPKYSSSSRIPHELEKCVFPTANSRIKRDRNFVPYRCDGRPLGFLDHPEDLDLSLAKIYKPPMMMARSILKHRPLFGMSSQVMLKTESNKCTLDYVKVQLQTAIQLEWVTLPTYLTSLYSIVDGCNTEVYNLIRQVVMQEMLHFTQAANILIAMNGVPEIDSADVAASYPTKLPGSVLPSLTVTLEKITLHHVHDIFMGIELPQKTEVGGDINTTLYTIGEFYSEISDCINMLGDDVFNNETLDLQVQWPWNDERVGVVYPITDSLSAVNAITAIISEGEGANLLDPTDITNNTLAHFFKFEEIVCQKHLKQISNDNYSYSGNPIPFNSKGVWPMRPNPNVTSLIPDTNCYTEARVFHQVYRNLLRKLQTVFNGKPEEIFGAVSIMESLKVHAKRLMWTKFNPSDPDDPTTCGPVWDYDWPDN